jgi:DNA-binding CsgD family transcriptional regulator
VTAKHLLDPLGHVLDRQAMRNRRVKVGVETSHAAGQAHHQERGRWAEHREGVRGSRGNGDRPTWPEIVALVFNLDDHAALQDVVGLCPADLVERRGAPPGSVDLEELVLAVGILGGDLDRQYRVGRDQLGAFAGGGVLDVKRHGPDAKCADEWRRSQNCGNACRTQRWDTEGVWEERALRARRDIAALAAAGLGVGELHAQAIRVIENQVRTEMTCWAAIDPETLVISTMTNGETQIAPEYEPRLAESEYSPDEPHTFAALARRNEAVAKLSDMPDGQRRRSARFNNVWRPLGLDQECRVMFLTDGACWGGAGMVRAGRDFTDRETEFLAAVAPAIAAATRVAVRSEALRGGTTGRRPAVVVLGQHGALHAVTPAAREWQNRLDQIAPGRFLLMMQVMAVGARSAPTGEFRARLRDAGGEWAVLQASPLIGAGDAEIAVAIEPAAGDQLIGLLLAAYGMSTRERQICREVIAGRSTADIAGRLFISPNTVQDHLKSIFRKVGVRSRGELVARLRPGGADPENAETSAAAV